MTHDLAQTSQSSLADLDRLQTDAPQIESSQESLSSGDEAPSVHRTLGTDCRRRAAKVIENESLAELDEGASAPRRLSAGALPYRKGARWSRAESRRISLVLDGFFTPWCGQCDAQPISDGVNAFPSRVKYNACIASTSWMSSLRSDQQEHSKSHWVQNIADLALPDINVEQVFTNSPHPLFNHVSVSDISHLEVKMRQKYLKMPHLSAVVDDGPHSRTDIESSALRMILQREAADRNAIDLELLHKYLRSTDMFRDMPQPVLKDVADSLTWRRCYEQDGEICVARQPLTHLHLITAGNVTYGATKGNDECCQDTNSIGIRGSKFVLGLRDVQDSGGLGDPWSWFDLKYSFSAKPDGSTEIITVSIDILKTRLQQFELAERIRILAQFPPTSHMSVQDFGSWSKVVRNGSKVVFIDLFKVKEVPRYFKFYQLGETLAPSAACIWYLVSGEVQLKSRGMSVETVSSGNVLGEESLRDEACPHTAIVSSAKAKVLYITALDYLAQFGSPQAKTSTNSRTNSPTNALSAKIAMKKSARRKKKRTFFHNDAVGDEAEESETENSDHAAPKTAKEWAMALKMPLKMQEDMQAILRKEWKTLTPRQLLQNPKWHQEWKTSTPRQLLQNPKWHQEGRMLTSRQLVGRQGVELNKLEEVALDPASGRKLLPLVSTSSTSNVGGLVERSREKHWPEVPQVSVGACRPLAAPALPVAMRKCPRNPIDRLSAVAEAEHPYVGVSLADLWDGPSDKFKCAIPGRTNCRIRAYCARAVESSTRDPGLQELLNNEVIAADIEKMRCSISSQRQPVAPRPQIPAIAGSAPPRRRQILSDRLSHQRGLPEILMESGISIQIDRSLIAGG